MATQTQSWGDQVDEEITTTGGGKPTSASTSSKKILKDGILPEPITINEDGVKKIISYSRNEEGKIEKKTRIFRVEVRKASANPKVLERRKWKKFGESLNLPPGPSAGQTTIGDDVYLVLKSKQEITDSSEAGEASIASQLVGKKLVMCRICKGDHWTKGCPYQGQIKPIEDTPDAAGGGEDGASGASSAPAPSKDGRYVPPSMRPGGRVGESMGTRDEAATIRVTNLSENTREEDLRELFRPFGPVSRCYLATDRDTGAARGFAFINYLNKDDAQKAIDAINGHGYDHLILQVEWAKPTDK